MARRYKMGNSYVERSKTGQFMDWASIPRALARDRATKAKTKVKPGYGHRGDQKVAKKRLSRVVKKR